MKLFTLFFFIVITAEAQIRPADQQYMQGENYLLNNGFESGRTNWTQAGTATATLEQSVVRFGLQSLKIVSSAQTVNLSQIITKYAAQSSGQQGIVSAWIKSTSAIAQVCAVVDSVDTKCVTIEASNTWKEYVIPFIMGSTNNGIRVKSASDSATTYIDQAFVGVMPATMMPNVENISQWVNYGAITITATTTNPTKGATRPEDNVRCRVVGQDYECQYRYRQTAAGSAGSGDYIFALPSGIEFDSSIPNFTTIARMDFNSAANAAFISADGQTSGNDNSGGDITSIIKYSDTSFRVAAKVHFSSAGNVSSTYNQLSSNPQSYSFNIKFRGKNIGAYTKIYSGDTIYPHANIVGVVKYTTGSNLVVSGTPMANNSMTVSTTGNVLNVCSDWTLGNGSGCTTGNKAVGVSFIPVNRGTYQICQTYTGHNTGAAANVDGFTVTGRTFNVGSATPILSFEGNFWSFATNYGARSSTHEYCQTIENPSGTRVNYAIVAPAATYSYPLLIANNSFQTVVKYFPPKDNPIIGTFEGIEKCANDFECTDVFSAAVSSTGAVSNENLNWINGNCTMSLGVWSCNYNAGIVSNQMNCNCTGSEGMCEVDSSSSSLVGGVVRNQTGSGTSQEMRLICQKQGSDYKPKTAKAATTNEMMYVPNVTRPKTCYYAFGGASATLASPTVCAASPCVEVYDSCSAGTAPTRSAAGRYEGFTFANGTWKASVPIMCKCRSFEVAGGGSGCVSRQLSTNSWLTNANGGYSSGVLTQNSAPVDTDSYVILECTADAP